MEEKNNKNNSKINRRDFFKLAGAGTFASAAALYGCSGKNNRSDSESAALQNLKGVESLHESGMATDKELVEARSTVGKLQSDFVLYNHHLQNLRMKNVPLFPGRL